MGCFSWNDCRTNKSIKIGKKCFLLIPKEYQEEYGERIETIYGGYGMFEDYDVYDLVARWNLPYKEKCISALRVPKEEDYLEKEYYERAMKRYERMKAGTVYLSCFCRK